MKLDLRSSIKSTRQHLFLITFLDWSAVPEAKFPKIQKASFYFLKVNIHSLKKTSLLNKDHQYYSL